MPIRRRHPHPSPNKNQAKAQRRQEEQDRQTLREVFPNVQHLRVDLSFFNLQGFSLGENSIAWSPENQVDFIVDCQGPCGGGRIDLRAKIAESINMRKNQAEGTSRCAQVLHAGSSDVCGTELRCRIDVVYQA